MKYLRWALLPLLLFPAACATLVPDYAIEKFSRVESCPTERITMKKFVLDPQTALVPRDPPAGVAADPARLAVWRSNVRDDAAWYRNLMAIDLWGCSVHRQYICWDEWDAEAETITEHCHDVDLSDPGTRFEAFGLDDATRRSLQAYFSR